MRWKSFGIALAVLALLWIGLGREVSLPAPSDARLVTFGAPGRQVAGRLFMTAKVSAHPHLIVVIHGDAPGHDPVYQYDFSRALAHGLEDTFVLALLRPGYRDGMGAASDGDRGLAIGDSYSEDAADQMGAAVAEAAARLQAKDVKLVGHSGGAALALIMLAQRPGLASGALIASCPCDLEPWRRHMAQRNSNPLFLLPAGGVSPLSKVGRLAKGLDLHILVGERDTVTPPWLSQRLMNGARARGVKVRLAIVPDAGHEILSNPAMTAAALGLLKSER
jgi:predicted esterase